MLCILFHTKHKYFNRTVDDQPADSARSSQKAASGDAGKVVVAFGQLPPPPSPTLVTPGQKWLSTKNRSPRRSTPRHPIAIASTAKPPNPMPCALAAILLPESRARTADICRKPCFPCLRSCDVGGRRESDRHPGYREAVPGTPGGRRQLVVLLGTGRSWGVPWHPGWVETIGRPARDWSQLGVARAHGRVLRRAALCLPAVRSRACVDAWAGAASGCSFRAVAQMPVCGPGLLLRETLIDYGNTPNNTYSQGGQELNASAGAC